jgi:hypothetical protein
MQPIEISIGFGYGVGEKVQAELSEREGEAKVGLGEAIQPTADTRGDLLDVVSGCMGTATLLLMLIFSLVRELKRSRVVFK